MNSCNWAVLMGKSSALHIDASAFVSSEEVTIFMNNPRFSPFLFTQAQQLVTSLWILWILSSLAFLLRIKILFAYISTASSITLNPKLCCIYQFCFTSADFIIYRIFCFIFLWLPQERKLNSKLICTCVELTTAFFNMVIL